MKKPTFLILVYLLINSSFAFTQINKKADKEFKTADNKFKMDAYHKYGNPKWFEELYTLTEDIKEFDMKNIVSGFHVYPIESWWDCKEGLKEYSDFVSTRVVVSSSSLTNR